MKKIFFEKSCRNWLPITGKCLFLQPQFRTDPERWVSG